jgi:tetratricopeptide (TPR) repeat protein
LARIAFFTLSFWLSAWCWPLVAQSKKLNATPRKEPTLEELVRGVTFVGDFEIKEETRPNSKEIFWRYPFSLPKIVFPLVYESDFNHPKLRLEFPQTEGGGRALQHLNRGRVLFLNGQVDEARNTWLGGRARYGRDYEQHRRADYFIAYSFFYTGIDLWKKAGEVFDRPDVRQSFVNASTFFSWAFDRKKDLPDPLLDEVAPKAYYNLAAIYYAYERWGGVVGAVSLGLDFLRQSGRKEYRRDLRRMMAETHIRNQDYLEAVRELDLTLRQDEDLETAAAVFARIGDIYFGLNNFELAEEIYALAAKIDRELKYVRPSQYILRGESMFWLGRFEESRRMMEYALRAAHLPHQHQEGDIGVMPRSLEDLDVNMQALASMRIADSWLALRQFDKAKLAYFRHADEFRGHVTAAAARIRLACLELPYYDGRNIEHARKLLGDLKHAADIVPGPAQEMAWTCETASYAQHERTPDMVERVRAFAGRYPDSSFLKELVNPVREVQARHIQTYFKAGDAHGAVEFFEKTREALFPTVSASLGAQLFMAYVDIKQTEKARPFLDAYRARQLDDLGWLRLAVALAEFGQASKGKDDLWQKTNRQLGDRLLELKPRLEPTPRVKLMLNRILATAFASAYHPWILQLGMQWSAADVAMACDFVYPLLERMKDQANSRLTDQFRQQAEAFIDKSLKDLLRFETNCAYSIMEFEVQLHADRLAELAAKYQSRSYLPLNAETAGMIWNVAELSARQGLQAEAQSLWRMLVAKGPENLPEVRYARMRLDTRKTELEDLWQNEGR